METAHGTVTTYEQDRTLVIELANPPVNAWSDELVADLTAVLAHVATTAHRAVVLTGSAAHWGGNVMEGEAPYYRAYECADGRWYTVGAVEPKLYANLLDQLGITDVDLADQDDQAQWPALRERIAAAFRTRPRDEWEERFGGLDVSGAPMLEIDELAGNEHLGARGLVEEREGGWLEARPAPHLTATPGRAGEVVARSGQHGDEIREQLARDPGAFPRATSRVEV